MIPSKDAKELLYKLFAERFISLQVPFKILPAFMPFFELCFDSALLTSSKGAVGCCSAKFDCLGIFCINLTALPAYFSHKGP